MRKGQSPDGRDYRLGGGASRVWPDGRSPARQSSGWFPMAAKGITALSKEGPVISASAAKIVDLPCQVALCGEPGDRHTKRLEAS
jgi:hypothetical protein